MLTKPPKNDRNYYWTMHSQYKLAQYGLSPNKIKRIIRYPERKETGIAPETIAVMKKRNKKDPKKGEIWVMYQRKLKVPAKGWSASGGKTQNSKIKVKNTNANVNAKNKNSMLQTVYDRLASNNFPGQIKIISAWIYPGVSPKGKEIFVPDEVWQELEKDNEENKTAGNQNAPAA